MALDLQYEKWDGMFLSPYFRNKNTPTIGRICIFKSFYISLLVLVLYQFATGVAVGERI